MPAVQSMLRDQGCDWELVLVDQSDDDATGRALQEAGALKDPRLVYALTDTRGQCRGRNEGLRRARGDVLAFTDDDCIVPAGWCSRHLETFARMPDLAVAYGAVVAEGGNGNGWVPVFHPLREGLVRPSPDTIRSLGIGANHAVRRSAFDAIGLYDEVLGPGAPFRGGDDTDLGYRAVAAGLDVYAAHEPAVTHRALPGARKQYVYGLIGMLMKHVRCGDRALLPVVVKEFARWAGGGTANLVRGRGPSGYRAAFGVLQAVVASFRFRVDRKRRLYRPWFAR